MMNKNIVKTISLLVCFVMTFLLLVGCVDVGNDGKKNADVYLTSLKAEAPAETTTPTARAISSISLCALTDDGSDSADVPTTEGTETGDPITESVEDQETHIEALDAQYSVIYKEQTTLLFYVNLNQFDKTKFEVGKIGFSSEVEGVKIIKDTNHNGVYDEGVDDSWDLNDVGGAVVDWSSWAVTDRTTWASFLMVIPATLDTNVINVDVINYTVFGEGSHSADLNNKNQFTVYRVDDTFEIETIENGVGRCDFVINHNDAYEILEVLPVDAKKGTLVSVENAEGKEEYLYTGTCESIVIKYQITIDAEKGIKYIGYIEKDLKLAKIYVDGGFSFTYISVHKMDNGNFENLLSTVLFENIEYCENIKIFVNDTEWTNVRFEDLYENTKRLDLISNESFAVTTPETIKIYENSNCILELAFAGKDSINKSILYYDVKVYGNE